jgi:hypothetical protein
MFKSKEELDNWLKEKYGTKKGQPMYRDSPTGEAVQTGKIYGYWNEDISHPYNDDGTKSKWFQQDWVEIREVEHKYG